MVQPAILLATQCIHYHSRMCRESVPILATLYNTCQQAFRCLEVSFKSFCRHNIMIIILFVWFPGVAGYIAHPPGPPLPNHPVGYSFHPLSQVSAQPPQSMAPCFQMLGKVIVHHSIVKFHVWCIGMRMQLFQVLLAIHPFPLVPLHLTLDAISHHLSGLNFQWWVCTCTRMHIIPYF
jgi:hypothetical protein